MIWIATKIESTVPEAITHFSWIFHQNPFKTFWVIMLTSLAEVNIQRKEEVRNQVNLEYIYKSQHLSTNFLSVLPIYIYIDYILHIIKCVKQTQWTNTRSVCKHIKLVNIQWWNERKRTWNAAGSHPSGNRALRESSKPASESLPSDVLE